MLRSLSENSHFRSGERSCKFSDRLLDAINKFYNMEKLYRLFDNAENGCTDGRYLSIQLLQTVN